MQSTKKKHWYYFGRKPCGCRVAVQVDMLTDRDDYPGSLADKAEWVAETLREWEDDGLEIEHVQMERVVVGEHMVSSWPGGCPHKLQRPMF